MKPRTASRLGWSLCAIAVVLSVGGAGLAAVMSLRTPSSAVRDQLAMAVILGPVAPSWAVVGALVAARRPGSQIAWLYCTIGLGLALLGASAAYFAFAVSGPFAPLPGGRVAAWAIEALFVPCVFIGPVSMFFVFPDGHFLSRRWRRFGLTTIGLGLLCGGAAVALRPGTLEGLAGMTNPLGVGGQAGRVMRFLADRAGAVLGPVGLVSAMLAMIRRYGETTGIERQQLKWVAYAVGLALVAFAVSLLAPVPRTSGFLGGNIADVPGVFAFVLMPVCTGIAIMRYRLYEIDRVINRTLVYGALTVCLALAYLVSVLVLQHALSAVTGGSGLAVAASTLAVAAAFRPARARIQRLVDRRFFRRGYDSARTLESFGARVRDEVALDALSAELRAVVADALQPTQVSLWLRDARP